MKEVFVQYAAYNVWANNLLLNVIELLPEAQQTAEIKSSFPSLLKTVLHMLDASGIWWQRLKLQEKISRPGESFNGDFSDLSKAVQQQDKQWLDWIKAATELHLQHEFIYYNFQKERFKQPVFQMLLHLFNHNTYHRGQLITMLRQADVEKLPSTDFILWSRKK